MPKFTVLAIHPIKNKKLKAYLHNGNIVFAGLADDNTFPQSKVTIIKSL